MISAHAPAIPDGGSLAAYAALAGTIVSIVVGGFNAWNQRQTKRQKDAAASESEAKSFVLATGDPVQWRTTDHQSLLDERAYTEQLGTKLREAEGKVRNLLDRVAEQDRKIDALVENIHQLRLSIRACPGGPGCPLHAVGQEPPLGDPSE